MSYGHGEKGGRAYIIGRTRKGEIGVRIVKISIFLEVLSNV